jgi:hypothetical protein
VLCASQIVGNIMEKLNQVAQFQLLNNNNKFILFE